MADNQSWPSPSSKSITLFALVVFLSAAVEGIACIRYSTNRIWRRLTWIAAVAQFPFLCWFLFLAFQCRLDIDMRPENPSQRCSALTIFLVFCGLACLVTNFTACVRLIVNAAVYPSGYFYGPAQVPPLLPMVLTMFVLVWPFWFICGAIMHGLGRRRATEGNQRADDDIPMQSIPVSTNEALAISPRHSAQHQG